MDSLTDLADRIEALAARNSPLPSSDLRMLLYDHAALLAAALRVASAAKAFMEVDSDADAPFAVLPLNNALAALATLTSRGGGR